MSGLRSERFTPPAVPTVMVLLVAVLTLVANATVWIVLDRDGRVMFLENGPMENLQLSCLLIGVVLFGVASIRCDRATRIGLLGICILLLNMAMREFEPEEAGLTGALLWLLDSTGRDIILTVLWLAWAVVVALNFKAVWQAALGFDRLIFGLLIAGGLFYAIGSLVDHTMQAWPPERQMFTQEFIETHGGLLIAWAGVVLLIEVLKHPRSTEMP